MMIDQLVVQDDLGDIINDLKLGKVVSESFWFKLQGQTLHVKCELLNKEIKFTSVDDDDKSIKFHQVSSYDYELIVSGMIYKIKIPEKSIDLITNAKITSIDISPNGENIAIGDSQGTIYFGKLKNGKVIIEHTIETAHFSDVLKLAFFPSSLVVLSIGLDYTINVWSFLDGSNPRTMKKQKGRLTDFAIIGRGRNVITSSLDGSIVIWECGSGKPIWEFRRAKNLNDSICAIVIKQNEITLGKETSQDKFVEMEGKYCYAGHKSGIISIWDLESRSFIGEFSSTITTSSVKCMHMTEDLLIVGYTDGHIICFDEKNSKHSVKWEIQVTKSEHDTESMLFEQNGDVIYCLYGTHLIGIDMITGTITTHLTGLNSKMVAIVNNKDKLIVAGNEIKQFSLIM
ncbi:hypothetical protein CANARDRAFT_30488 [[Candida] arabinofermentans NRRL YB-2248]|uniref:Uncharacterized protein n=1 Tax=[Candida] arabinofermentans NRRL YB-2248 TaxID=983967 RepID=A0A1E4STT5_9ASCO|nr:hypothetical protein CANARDRAFT_30488 [[Candida] arabinofermentans NRRL YB-2248]